MSDFFVTLASYWYRSDAMLAQHALEAAGIESVLEGMKLRVRNTDALRAGAVLDAQCASLEEIAEADEEQEVICPNCGSENVVRHSRTLLLVMVAVIVISIGVAVDATQPAFFAAVAIVTLLLISDRYRCAECEETFN